MKINTLAKAKERIAELEAQLTGKAPVESLPALKPAAKLNRTIAKVD